MDLFSPELGLALFGLGLLILLGWLMASRGWVEPRARQSIMRLIIWVFFPAMIFERVCRNPLIASGGQALLYLGAGFLLIVTGYAVAMAVGALAGLPEGVRRRTFAFSAGMNNFGYLGIPVTAALFNQDVVGVLLVHNVGVEAAVWTVGIAMLSGSSLRRGLVNLLQPMTVALFLALAVNLAGLGDSQAVGFLGRILKPVGECAIPVGTLLSGMYLHELLGSFRPGDDLRVSVSAVAVRWALMPPLVLGTVFLCVDDVALRQVMLVQAAMPCGIFTFLIVDMFKGDSLLSLRCSAVTMLLCVVITPLWLKAGRLLLGV